MPQTVNLPILLKLAVAAVLAILPRAVLAGEDESAGEESRGALFERLDANDDGKLTGDEIPEDHQRLFRRLLRNADENEDEQLTREEFTSGLRARRDRGPRDGEGVEGRRRRRPPEAGGPEGRRRPPRDFDPEQAFKRMDANDDGKLTLDEVPEPRREGFRRMLERLDNDESEGVTLEQFKRVAGRRGRPPGERGEGRSEGRGRSRPDERGRRGSDDRGRRRPPEGGPQRRRERGPRGPEGRPPAPPLLRALDTDRDGSLSSSEISAASKSLKKLDRDDDGVISRRELMPPRPRRGRDGHQEQARRPRFHERPHGEDRRPPEGRREEYRRRPDGPPDRFRGRPDGPDRRSRGGHERRREGFRGRPDGPGPSLDAVVRRIMKGDEDGDGKLSKEETPERMRERFDQIDTDDDGQIDESELKKAMGRFLRRRGGERPGPPRERPNRRERSDEV